MGFAGIVALTLCGFFVLGSIVCAVADVAQEKEFNAAAWVAFAFVGTFVALLIVTLLPAKNAKRKATKEV